MSGERTGQDVESVAALDTPVHRLDPRVKILALVAVAAVSVTTPPGAWAAFGAYLALLAALAAAARLRPRYVLRRMVVEVPFLVGAALLPLTVPEGTTLALSVALKVTVGVLAMVVLSSTTPFPRLLRGFESLRAPRVLVMIVAFMWRYLHVLGDEVRRMRIAREARGYQGRWLWQAGAVAAAAATLFVRALERGERVWVAMASRGYAGGVPPALGDDLTLRPADVTFCAVLTAALAVIRWGLG